MVNGLGEEKWQVEEEESRGKATGKERACGWWSGGDGTEGGPAAHRRDHLAAFEEQFFQTCEATIKEHRGRGQFVPAVVAGCRPPTRSFKSVYYFLSLERLPFPCHLAIKIKNLPPMNPRALLHRQPLVGLALAAMLGIAAADYLALPFPWAFALAPIALLTVLLWPRQVTCWLFCAAVFFELHAVRHWGGNARWLAGVLASGPRVVHATGIVGNEPEKPHGAARTVTCRFLLKLESVSIAEQPMTPDALVEVSWVGPVLAYGDRVTFIGGAQSSRRTRAIPASSISPATNSASAFSPRFATRFPIDCHIVSPGHGNPFQAFGFAARHWLKKRLEIDLADSPEIMAVIDGVVPVFTWRNARGS